MQEDALDIRLFGGLRIRQFGQALANPGSARQRSLLAWLLLHADTPQLRRHMAFTFWPDTPERQALTNLRRELHNLRQRVPAAEACLDVSAQTLCWCTGSGCTLDTAAFDQALAEAADGTDDEARQAALERAAALYRGELLTGLADEWVEPLRQSFHQRMVEALEHLFGLYHQQGDTERALTCGQRLLELEPLHEPAYARLMQLHLARGERPRAKRVFEQGRRALADELGARPGEVLRHAYNQLREQAPPPTQPDELPLIGRKAEWAELLGLWDGVCQGGAAAVLITGEAGIGKTRLAEAMLAQSTDEDAIGARTRSYAAEGRLAFAPLAEWLRSPALQGNLERLEAPKLTEMARLLPELLQTHPGLPAPQPLSEGWQRQQLFEALAQAIVSDTPTLLLFDDLQWCDRDTLEWLHYLLRFDPTAPLLLLGTMRSEEQDDNPALNELLTHLQQEGLLHRMGLGALDRVASAALAESTAQARLEKAVQTRLFNATEGHPLFIVEAVRAGLGAEDEKQQGDAVGALPRVQGIIAARLSQLGETAREVAQTAAVIGRAFDVDVLRSAAELDEGRLVGALEELWQRSVIREQEGTGRVCYDFSHDRLREGAYAQLSPVRQRLLHWRVARALESAYSDQLRRISAELAAHYEQAGEYDKAIGCYQQAAERANDLSASREAIRLAKQALALLEQLSPGTGRDRRELALNNALAAALSALHGFTTPELEAVLNRARQLGEALDDQAAVIRSLWGLFALHIVRGNVGLARDVAEQSMRMTGEDTALLTDCHHALGGVELTEAKPASARTHFETANRLYHQHRARRVLFGADVGVFSLAWGSHGVWLQGDIDQAREQVARAEALAAELGHPFTTMQAGAYRSIYWQFERHLDNAWATAEATVAGCQEYNIGYYHEWGVIIGGWVQAMRGDIDAGSARIRRGLDGLRGQDAFLRRPYYLSLLAEVRLAAGDPKEARALLDAAMTVAQQNDDLWWLPELWRLRGYTESEGEIETCFRRALDIANQQGSRSLALRAATSLAEWLHENGRSQEAVAQLEPVCAAFPAYLESNDLSAVRSLLNRIG